MDFFTRCWRNRRLEAALRSCIAAVFLLSVAGAWAQVATDISKFQIERVEDDLQLNAQVQFELPANVEDALLKGIPMVFLATADILRERWYWYDKKVSAAERHMRLSYQPLTRRWRLSVAPGSGASGQVGLVLNQNFDTLPQAMTAIKRISGWKIAQVSDLDSGSKYRVEFRFRLDLNQLPRPFQIGAIGQTDWELSAGISTALGAEAFK